MPPDVSDSGDWSQVLEESAIERAENPFDSFACRCPRCNRFGVVAGNHSDFGTIYRCNCKPLFWLLNPETGKKIESGEVITSEQP